MNDFNFFQEYKSGKNLSKSKFRYGIIILIIVVAFIGITYVGGVVKIKKLNKDINSMEAFLNSKENIEKLKQIENENKKIEILNKYNDIITVVDKVMYEKNVVGSEIIEKVTSSIPEKVYFKSLVVNSENIQIQGEGENRSDIAEFENNLKKIESITNIHINNISKVEGKNFVFTLKCDLKGVDSYEGN
ncbi:PilN domain-containing protein [Haloimpatiens sp. FM7330]|uniref:PilN domain-containing protein n=1 Tax=Haloimpatiens sp. FM7330 TaxID=3298610 RepID=UPI003627D915